MDKAMLQQFDDTSKTVPDGLDTEPFQSNKFFLYASLASITKYLHGSRCRSQLNGLAKICNKFQGQSDTAGYHL